MSVINYSVDESAENGDVIVTWPALTVGDVGQDFPCRGLELKAVMSGAPGAGAQTSLFEASIQETPVDFAAISPVVNSVFLTPYPNSQNNGFFSALRPRITAGPAGSQDFSAIFRRA